MLNKDTINAIIHALERQARVLHESNNPNAAQAIGWTKQAMSLVKAIERGDTIASLWSVEDVYSLCEDFDGNQTITLKDHEARRVLALAEENFDAEQGINWDTLRYQLDDVLAERGEDPNGGDGIDD